MFFTEWAGGLRVLATRVIIIILISTSFLLRLPNTAFVRRAREICRFTCRPICLGCASFTGLVEADARYLRRYPLLPGDRKSRRHHRARETLSFRARAMVSVGRSVLGAAIPPSLYVDRGLQ